MQLEAPAGREGLEGTHLQVYILHSRPSAARGQTRSWEKPK